MLSQKKRQESLDISQMFALCGVQKLRHQPVMREPIAHRRSKERRVLQPLRGKVLVTTSADGFTMVYPLVN